MQCLAVLLGSFQPRPRRLGPKCGELALNCASGSLPGLIRQSARTQRLTSRETPGNDLSPSGHPSSRCGSGRTLHLFELVGLRQIMTRVPQPPDTDIRSNVAARLERQSVLYDEMTGFVFVILARDETAPPQTPLEKKAWTPSSEPEHRSAATSRS